ncbi:MAG: hypothetical protein JO033_14820 [Acidobacteriaceae bacterium]|nr:hypothetical protein [Acidobacteriaceae bacterium]MBV9498963.1 hypothetical protein [Acidobacteriaceae bacterium]
MTDPRTDRSEWTSFLQLIQELIGGVIRRHTFTQWELELLLDLQVSKIRKSSRPDVLRRYLRSVQHQNGQGAPNPLRLSNFLAAEAAQREAQVSGTQVASAAAARFGD